MSAKFDEEGATNSLLNTINVNKSFKINWLIIYIKIKI